MGANPLRGRRRLASHATTTRRAIPALPQPGIAQAKHERGWYITGAIIIAAIILYGRPQVISGLVILIVIGTLSLIALLRNVPHPPPLLLPWLFVLTATASAFWSTDAVETLRRCAALAVPLFAAGQIALYVPFDRFLKIADYTFRTAILSSILMGLFAPGIGLTQAEVLHGTLRGIFIHRNLLGYMIILGVVTLLARRWNRQHGPTATLGWLLIYLFALQWAGSAGAIVLVLFTCCVYGFVRWLARNPQSDRGAIVVVAVLLLSVSSLITHRLIPVILDLLGRDLTFSNRIYIWEGAWNALQERYWLGYGWGTILREDNTAATQMRRAAGWEVTSTHNGYLATALQIGVIGLAISILFLCVLLKRTLCAALRNPGPQAFWSLQVVLILILGDFIETRAFTNIGWFLLCLIGYYSYGVTEKSPPAFMPARSALQS